MIDGSEKHNCQLAFKLQNSHVCEKRSKIPNWPKANQLAIYRLYKLVRGVELCAPRFPGVVNR